jgi:hypothetical protein
MIDSEEVEEAKERLATTFVEKLIRFLKMPRAV